MRKTFVTRTVLQCPEAWQLFCDNFPAAVIMAEDAGNPEVLIVYTDDQKDELCQRTCAIALIATGLFHLGCLVVSRAGLLFPRECATQSGQPTAPVKSRQKTRARNTSRLHERP